MPDNQTIPQGTEPIQELLLYEVTRARDGGTILAKEFGTENMYHIDYSIRTTTPGSLWKGYPRKEGSVMLDVPYKLVPKEQQKQAEGTPAILPGPFLQYLNNKAANLKATIIPMNSPNYFIGCNANTNGRLDMLKEIVNEIKAMQ